MKLVIDIPDREYKQRIEFPLCYDSTIDKAIVNGTPLSEKLEKIRAEIKGKIEQEEFARSVFRHEEKDTVKAEQCTGSIMAYKNVIILFDKYKAESEDIEFEEDWRNEDFNHEGFYNFLLNTIQPNEMEKYRNMFLSSGQIVN